MKHSVSYVFRVALVSISSIEITGQNGQVHVCLMCKIMKVCFCLSPLSVWIFYLLCGVGYRQICALQA